MIITATPYRISFFGGGTDYSVWYREHGGAVLATTINRYCYISGRFLPPYFDFKHRIVWSKIELTDTIDDIEHPAVREAIRYIKFDEGLEIHHNGDLPARAGLGSSSSFAVGILHTLHVMKGSLVPKKVLAKEAIMLEQELLKENVGIQDQISSAVGGMNLIEIDKSGDFSLNPIPMDNYKKALFESYLMLFYTGVSRFASEVAKAQIESIPDKQETLHEMQKMVWEAAEILMNGRDISDFGRLLHENWLLKRSITNTISSDLVDEIYNKGRLAGATGGKLLGAGGGGFMLFFAPPDKHQSILEALSDLLYVPFELEHAGTHISVYEPGHYSMTGLTSRDFVR